EEYGVTVAQENVSYCLSGRLDFLRMMKRELGKYAKFVLDLKQCRRSHEDIFEVVRALGEDIIHLHVSDANSDRDCMPIGQGCFDFRRLMQEMGQLGYSGAYMVELYRRDYDEYPRLRESVDRLRDIADSL
ncbi:MAG TPA: sugar phosphate isomerase, partial [Ruminococcaceae bacterium]|nr:sugar phosphate isomerase [Oscillospiraceae bacterium]